MKATFRFALVAAALGMFPAVTLAEVDCIKLAVSVKNAAAAQPAKVLSLVEAQIAENPDCACEVVKAAIQGAAADSKTVAGIVEVAATVLPEKMRMISQCAVAAAPESLADVQAVMNRLDPNRGESGHSAKDAKGAKDVAVKPAWNPLDFPGQGPIGPTPGGPPIVPPGLPPGVPPVITPPVGTRVNRPVTPPVGSPDPV
jgi:hypothetical protein